ncbi:MAG: type II toxin-antitoxin system Phd/YefM family antitoxin [Boseongicola sp. SB0664_bin_43]|uniref:Antitoxin n=1 Tax=Boseongicola sp. SB0664_bin_43 TaxID=2604844 RepID=A0A6B0XWI2_9RHOB|nr:type II toxin-antitoxin system Phd/YefM family antitoxin [Boseongicola sp. SB0664_bin_43]
MTSHMIKINASDFKARCLAILDNVHETGERVVILKRGRPVAELSRVAGDSELYPQSELEGTVVIVGDVVGPVLPEEHWDSLKE